MSGKVVDFSNFVNKEAVEHAKSLRERVDQEFDRKKPLHRVAYRLLSDLRAHLDKVVEGDLAHAALCIPKFNGDGSVEINIMLNTSDIKNASYLSIKVGSLNNSDLIPESQSIRELISKIDMLENSKSKYAVVAQLRSVSKIPVVAFSKYYDGRVSNTDKLDNGWRLSMVSAQAELNTGVELSVEFSENPLAVLDAGIAERHERLDPGLS